MKVERINENQIKVIMSAQDLIDRNITLSEVAYGSEKGHELFEEVMTQAREIYDFHFDENYPLIIEAIPMSKSEITLIISKVSQFSDFEKNFNFLPQTKEERKFIKKSAELKEPDKEAISVSNENLVSIYSMKALDDVINASARIGNIYDGINYLYKHDKKYYLIVHPDSTKDEADFNMLERILSDYGQKHLSTPVAKMYIMERGELIAERAVQNLYKMN